MIIYYNYNNYDIYRKEGRGRDEPTCSLVLAIDRDVLDELNHIADGMQEERG